jgi:sulfite exporter TauE/SafE
VSEGLSATAAFLIGLLGSVHCIGMCGGIVGALTMGLPVATRRSSAGMLAYLLAYNIGRITSYAVAGALAGVAGSSVYGLVSSGTAMRYSHWITGAFMLALGVYLMGWTRILAPIERAGARLWRHMEPLGRRLLPVRHPGQALGLGLVWGWLPCGLVYSALVWALAAGDALRGAQVMVAFGLGTLPMLLSLGAAARWLGDRVRRPWVRQGAGALIVAFGLATLFAPGLVHRHSGGGADHVHHQH